MSIQDSAPKSRLVDHNVARWLALGGGGALAIVALYVPLLALPLDYCKILVHELGHVVTAWLFGYPSLPGFDLVFGGGITLHGHQRFWLLLIVYCGWGWLLYRSRERPRALGVTLLALLAYSLCAFTSWRYALILFMGHGSELVFAGLFLYRAISGRAIRTPLDRPAYAWVGIYIVLADIRFALRLIAEPGYRRAYEAAKGGGHWMDFSRLADDHLHTSLQAVALIFLLCCLLPVPGAILWHRRTRGSYHP